MGAGTGIIVEVIAEARVGKGVGDFQLWCRVLERARGEGGLEVGVETLGVP
jgi:hypothetical protein